ncbi:MAG: class I SAM-dependent methyltransferase [Roseomonas sp.]|nr:class I SAM-dependent methyltransferase [Roseomonas sp.]
MKLWKFSEHFGENMGLARKLARQVTLLKARALQRKYRSFTMIPAGKFIQNLMLCWRYAPKTGCIVECGVWRGGMSAGISELLPGRQHYLLDSFEGLPPPREVDGTAAFEWQKNTNSPAYYDNCSAEISFAQKAMTQGKAKTHQLIKGWFRDTLADFVAEEPIAVLRLDGDWYDSTMECLQALYPKVMLGGVIILDDYGTWDGCTRAVHDYLSREGLADPIRQYHGVTYIIRRDTEAIRVGAAT